MEDKVLFKPVEREIFVDGKVVNNRKAIVNPDNKEVIGIVSNVYKVVSNKEILNHFTSIAESMKLKWEFKGGSLIRNGAKTIMNIEFPKTELTVAKGDVLKLQGYLINGFNGFSKAKLVLGYVRLVCTNGMVIGTDEMTISYKHVGDVNERIISTFRGYLEEKLKTTEQYVRKLKTITFSIPNAEMIVEKSVDWLSQKYLPLVTEQISSTVGRKESMTAWDLYNSFTYIMAHSMPTVNAEGMIELHRKLYSSSVLWKEEV